MTEEEWLICCDPDAMLAYVGNWAIRLCGQIGCVRPRMSERKLRLFACACCSRFVTDWHVSPTAKIAIEAAELRADGVANSKHLRELHKQLTNQLNKLDTLVRWETEDIGLLAETYALRLLVARRPNVRLLIRFAQDAAASGGRCRNEYTTDDLKTRQKIDRNIKAEQKAQSNLLREICGNPFQPLTPSPVVRGDLRERAQSIYDDRAFEELPEFADILQAVNYPVTQVIDHCRDGGAHVRGCWALDFILAK